jgi:hypothetical protein
MSIKGLEYGCRSWTLAFSFSSKVAISPMQSDATASQHTDTKKAGDVLKPIQQSVSAVGGSRGRMQFQTLT